MAWGRLAAVSRACVKAGLVLEGGFIAARDFDVWVSHVSPCHLQPTELRAEKDLTELTASDMTHDGLMAWFVPFAFINPVYCFRLLEALPAVSVGAAVSMKPAACSSRDKAWVLGRSSFILQELQEISRVVVYSVSLHHVQTCIQDKTSALNDCVISMHSVFMDEELATNR